MKSRIGVLLTAAVAVFLPVASAWAQAQNPVQVLAGEVRSLRTEIRTLRRDLSRARADAAQARKQAGEAEARLAQSVGDQQEQVRRLKGQAGVLTVWVVLLGGCACLALLLAARRPAVAEASGLSEARSRISRLRSQLEADEARLAALQRRDPPVLG